METAFFFALKYNHGKLNPLAFNTANISDLKVIKLELTSLKPLN